MFVILSLCLLAFPLVRTQSGATPRIYGSGPLGYTDYPWTMFHDNAARTGVSAASGPATGSLMWSLSTTSLLYSSPAVVDGAVFISSYDGNVYAIDEYSGLQKWVFSTNQYVSSSPAVSNGLVYVTTACPLSSGGPFSCNGGSVYALDENTGSVVWQKLEARPITSSPLVADGRVFYGIIALGNGQVFARYATSGNGNWSIFLSDAIESPLSVDNGRVFVSQIDGAVTALNENNGSQIWRVVPLPTPNTFQTAPAVGNGMLFLGSTTRGVVALNENTGATVWTFATGGFNATSVTLNGGRVYFGTGRGIVYSLNATTGVQLWSRTTGGAVASSPALSLGSKTLFVGSNDRNLYSLNMTTGAVLWRYLTGSGVASSPAVVDSRVFFGSNDHKVYALGAIAPRLHDSVASNSTALKPGEVASLTVTVTNGTVPQPGSNLTFTSSAGGVFSQSTATGLGTYQANFTAPMVGSTVLTVIQVTASMTGYLSGTNQTSITLNPFPLLTVAVAPKPASITPGGEITLMIRVTNGTQLISGASLSLSSSAGGSFSSISDSGNGNYTAVFSTPLQNSNPTVTVQASKPGFTAGQGQATVAVNGIPDLTSLKIAGISFLLILAGGVLVFFLIIIGLVSRRKAEPRYPAQLPAPSYALGRGFLPGRLI